VAAASPLGRRPALLVWAGGRLCAVALEHVGEIMRPLPTEAVVGVPPFVRGIAVIRGVPTPVVDVAVLLDGAHGTIGRFVTMNVGGWRVALGVGAVTGIRDLASVELAAMPPLLGGVGAELIEAIGAADSRLLVVLRAARVVPDEVWTRLAAAGEA
jgi:purine-binding chemotaxis protein CheW